MELRIDIGQVSLLEKFIESMDNSFPFGKN